MDGIIIINKPKNCTSHDIVYKVKKTFNEKVGHTGTLDPMATGVLPILIGKGTLMSKYLINHDKIYEVELHLGIKTDTADIEGKIIEEKEVKKESLEKENIENVLKTFLGKQEQLPPMYSAIKVNGKKLYEYARKGQTVEIQKRSIEIYDITLININKSDAKISFVVKCSKGTYIRSLCEDIAIKLETVGYMSNLNRTRVGEFDIKNSVNIDKLKENFNENKEQFLEQNFISLEKMFEECEKLSLSSRDVNLVLNGVKITKKYVDGIYRIYQLPEETEQNPELKFIGIGVIKNNLLKRDIII